MQPQGRAPQRHCCPATGESACAPQSPESLTRKQQSGSRQHKEESIGCPGAKVPLAQVKKQEGSCITGNAADQPRDAQLQHRGTPCVEDPDNTSDSDEQSASGLRHFRKGKRKSSHQSLCKGRYDVNRREEQLGHEYSTCGGGDIPLGKSVRPRHEPGKQQNGGMGRNSREPSCLGWITMAGGKFRSCSQSEKSHCKGGKIVRGH